MRHSSDLTNYVKIYGVLIGYGAVLAVQSMLKIKKLRTIQDQPLSPIKTAPQGKVAIDGFAWPFEALTCPLTRNPVVYYQIMIQELQRSGKSSKWVSIFEDVSDKPFAIIDGTGFASVYPASAQREVKKQIKALKDLSEVQRGTLQSFLKFKGRDIDVVSTGLFSSKKRVILSAIYPGTPIYIQGHFVSLESALQIQKGASAFMRKIKSIAKGPSFEAIQFDMNKDGKITGEEWNQTGAAVALKTTQGPLAADEEFYFKSAGVLAHNQDSPLYIEDAHQRQAIVRKGRWLAARVAAGIILISVFLTLLILKIQQG